MSNLIQWPRAKYWTTQYNPIIGCNPCSPACEHCYAAAWAKRFGQSFEPHRTGQRPPKKGVVFAGNMTDLFGEWVKDPSDFLMEPHRDKVDENAVYLWLTKRVERMIHAVNQLAPRPFWDKGMWRGEHYFGFTAENQEWYKRRFCESCQIPSWANWWVSCEPLLGPIDLDLADRHPITGAWGVIPHLPSWVIVGCESGPSRRQCELAWVESIVEQCRAVNVPVFVKQICLPNGKFTNKIEEFPKHLQIRQVPWAKSLEEDSNGH